MEVVDNKLALMKCLIQWKRRLNGFSPFDSYLSSTFIKVRYPGLLIDFYESILSPNASN